MIKKFIEIDRDVPIILPQKFEGWLDENDLSRFIVEIVEQIDTSQLENEYKGRGRAAFPPKMMLALLFYCYAKGIFSSRKIERTTYELIPVLFICGGLHPDHDTINKFRQRFLNQFIFLFTMVLEIAFKLGIFKRGDNRQDGTKIEANASKHKAMSWYYANKLEAMLQAEVEMLLKQAEIANSKSNFDTIDIPAEIKRREERLAKIGEIKEEIEKRVQVRYENEKAEYEAKMEERAAKEAERGKKLGGRKPVAPEPGPKGKDQVNFTDGDSRIMPKSGGHFVQGYNAQASVDQPTMIIVGQHVTQNTNDKQEVELAKAELNKLPKKLGQVERAALDNGYFSDDNVNALVDEDIEPYIATGRQSHNQSLEERLAEPPKEPPENATPLEEMQHRLKTEEGKEFYGKDKARCGTSIRYYQRNHGVQALYVAWF